MSDTVRLDNRMLAERAGWTAIETKTGWFEDPWSMAYEEAYLEGTRPDGYTGAVIPDYLHDATAALTLPLDEGCNFQLYGYGDMWECDVISDGYMDERCSGRGETAAEAVALAWWAWQQEGR